MYVIMTEAGADLTICSGITLDLQVIGAAAHIDGNLALFALME